MKQENLKIEGMSCMHCVGRVKQALTSLAGISVGPVEVGKASVTYDETKLTREDMEAAIKKAGYKVTEIS